MSDLRRGTARVQADVEVLRPQRRAFGYIHRHAEMETFNLKAMTCPKCDATDRDRLMAIYLDEVCRRFQPAQEIRLIDFAPAYPLSQKIKQYPGIAYRSADLMRRDVQDNIDLTNIAYLDESVDVFICSHVLEHIPDDRKAMRELRRILQPGGFGLMLVPLVIGVDETHRGARRDIDRVPLEVLRHGRSRPPVRPA